MLPLWLDYTVFKDAAPGNVQVLTGMYGANVPQDSATNSLRSEYLCANCSQHCGNNSASTLCAPTCWANATQPVRISCLEKKTPKAEHELEVWVIQALGSSALTTSIRFEFELMFNHVRDQWGYLMSWKAPLIPWVANRQIRHKAQVQSVLWLWPFWCPYGSHVLSKCCTVFNTKYLLPTQCSLLTHRIDLTAQKSHYTPCNLATSETVLFPGYNHQLTISTDDPSLAGTPAIIKVSDHQHWWLAGFYDLEIGHFRSG